MASKTTKKKKTSKNTSRSTSKSTSKKVQQGTDLRGEITILAILAVCILIVLSNFGLAGMVGRAVSSVSFGLFGYMAYILPFIAFGITAFYISNKGNAHAYVKIAAGVVFFLILAAFLELIINKYTPGTPLFSYYTAASRHKNAGGLMGGCIVSLFCPLIGVVGTYVVLSVLSIICVILITEKSLLAPLGRQSRKAYEGAKRKHQETSAIRLQRREERRQQQASAQKSAMEKKIIQDKLEERPAGVSFATTADDSVYEFKYGLAGRKKSPELYELSPETPFGGSTRKQQESHFVINRAEEPVPEEPEIAPVVTEPVQETASEPVVAVEEAEENREEKAARKTKKTSKSDAEAIAEETAHMEEAVREQEQQPKKVYLVPPVSLLTKGKKSTGDSDEHLRATAMKLEQTLQNFGVGVHVTNASCGPSVTRYELQPEQGVKVSRIVGLADDIKLNLAVADLRIEAPIPGKAAVGIEVPNQENSAVMLRDLLESYEFKSSESPISFAVGKDIAGKVVVADIAKMPHLLVAGATGSGKSVCINTLIMSIIYKANPDDVKLVLVDPKVVELSVYNGIPHLMIPVVTDPKKAAGALNWAVAEMEKRYKLFAEYNVRDLKGFNAKVESGATGDKVKKKLPQIVIIIDELADLMMVAPGEVEGAICRLAQLARAAGLHLILATQRPSVNVITGLIKANMPSRIAFSVSSGVDSRTIIDMNGAEKLLGKGDMLFYPTGYPKPVRVQGSFVSDKEVQSVVEFLIEKNGNTTYNNELEEHMNTNQPVQNPAAQESGDGRDTYFVEAGKLIIDKEKASIGMLQRMFKIGFNRAARIMDQLAEAGVVGPEEGTKPRKVLMNAEEFESYLSGGEKAG